MKNGDKSYQKNLIVLHQDLLEINKENKTI